MANLRKAWITAKDKPALWLLGGIAALTHLPWLLLFKNFTSGDWWYIGIERYKDFAQFSPIWVTDGIGNTSAVPHFYLIRFLEGVLTYVGSSFALNEKLFFLIPMSFAAIFGMYALLRQYFSVWPSVIGAIVFAFNTPVLFNHVGPLTIGMAYALAPWCIYFFKRFLEEVNGKLLVASALAFSVVAVYELRIALIIIGVSVGLFVYNTLIGDGWAYAKKRLLPVAGLFCIVLLLHAFWVVPYAISSRAVTFSDLLSRGLFVSFSDIQNALTLHHPFWTGGRPATFVVQQIPLYAWIIPIAAFAGFVLRGTRAAKEMYYWGIIAALGLFLVKQVNEPFVTVYPWLFGHVPGFGAYRESSKFYLLIGLSFAVLIPFTLVSLRQTLAERLGHRHIGWPKVIAGSAAAVVTMLFLINTVPLLTGSFRTMYTPREMPSDYRKLEQFVHSQPQQFRTLWVPVTSRWGAVSNDHPALLATSVNQGGWLGAIGAGQQNTYATLRDKAVRLFQHPSSQDALDRAGVKYVIVPVRDTANEDDFFRYYGDDRQYYIDQLDTVPFLRKIDIGTDSLVVYENKTYQPYVSAFTSLQAFELGKTTDITTFHRFITRQTKDPFNFVDTAKQVDGADYPATGVTNIFQDLNNKDIAGKMVRKTAPAMANPVLSVSSANRHVRYQIAGDQLTFYARTSNDLRVNGKPVAPQPITETVIGQTTLRANYTYYLSDEGKPLELARKDSNRELGILDKPVTVYASLNRNIIPNWSFEDGTWHKTVKDCNNYDKQPAIGMRLKGGDATNGSRSLQLEADRHTACTDSQPLPAPASSYLLSFDYRVLGGRTTGYELHFNDTKNTVVKADISVTDAKWRTYQKIVRAPAGATQVIVRLLGYPDYRLQMHSVTGFDAVRLLPLNEAVVLPDPADTPDTHVPLPANTPLMFTYPNDARQTSNRIGNGNFEQGLWQRTVADCNDYDDSPQIGMRSVGHNGGQALELSAKRHDACTSNSRTSVHENTNYMLHFAYQSPNANNASFFVRFDDPAQTTIEETVPVADSGWHTYDRQIKAPLGASKMNIVVYARASETGNTTIINRYDDFTLREIPDLPNRYFLTDKPRIDMQAPRVAFASHSAVKKSITITDARAPFYLRMSEAYHPLWKLRFGTAQARDQFTQLPWKTAGLVPENTHFRLNDFQNGWYIDPTKLCGGQAACMQNSDGSWTIRLVAEFLPQRWFYFGSVFSLAALAGCLSYLLYYRTRQTKKEGKWHAR